MIYAEPIQRRIVATLIAWADNQGTAQSEQGETFTLTGDYDDWAHHVGKKVEIFAEFAPQGELAQLEFRLLPKVLNIDENMTTEQIINKYGVSALSEIDGESAIAGEWYWRVMFCVLMLLAMAFVWAILDGIAAWLAATLVALIWGGGLFWSEQRLREHEARFASEKQAKSGSHEM